MLAKVGDATVEIDWKHVRFEHPEPLLLPSGKTKLVKAYTSCTFGPAVGIAWCSIDDVFVKERGRKLSLTEAMKAAGIGREARAKVWEWYFERRGHVNG